MSAFMCDDLHISVLAEYAVQNHVCEPDPDFKRDYTPAMVLAERLHAENFKSIASRYPGDATMLGGGFQYDSRARWMARTLPAVQILKAVHCYQYQACEHDGWEKSQAKEVTDGIAAVASRNVPGYEQAAWGVPSPS